MPAPLSRDLRERIVEAVEGGSSMRGAAARFAVSPSSAIKLMARVRATGSVAPARYGGHRQPLLAPHEDVLRALVAEQPDITLAEIQAELRRQRGLTVCLATIHVRLRRLGLRHKKEPESGRAGPSRCRPAAAALAGLAALHGREPVRLPRRDRAQHQDDPPLWPGAARRAPGGSGAARPLAHHDVYRRPAPERRHRALGARWPDDWRRVP